MHSQREIQTPSNPQCEILTSILLPQIANLHSEASEVLYQVCHGIAKQTREGFCKAACNVKQPYARAYIWVYLSLGEVICSDHPKIPSVVLPCWHTLQWPGESDTSKTQS